MQEELARRKQFVKVTVGVHDLVDKRLGSRLRKLYGRAALRYHPDHANRRREAAAQAAVAGDMFANVAAAAHVLLSVERRQSCVPWERRLCLWLWAAPVPEWPVTTLGAPSYL